MRLYPWRPEWYDVIPTLLVGACAIVGPTGWPRAVAAALVTFQAATAIYLRYLEQRLASLREAEEPHP